MTPLEAQQQLNRHLDERVVEALAVLFPSSLPQTLDFSLRDVCANIGKQQVVSFLKGVVARRQLASSPSTSP